MTKSEEPGEREPDEQGLEPHLRVFVTEPTLWPVTAAAVLIAATFGAAVISYAWHDRNIAAQGALVILAGLSVFTMEPELRALRPGLATASVLVLWILSFLGSFALTATAGG
jgi:hypothetical protein